MRRPSAPRPRGFLHLSDAFFDLALVLGLGQFSLSDLSELDQYCGLVYAFDEAHEFSKINGDSAIDDSDHLQAPSPQSRDTSSAL